MPPRIRFFQEVVVSSDRADTAFTWATISGGGSYCGGGGLPLATSAALSLAERSSREVTNEGAFPGAEDDDADPVAAAELALAAAPKTENGAKRRVKLRALPAELLSEVAHRPGSATVGRITDNAEPGGLDLADPEAEAPFAAAEAAAAAPGLAVGAR